MWDKPPDKRRDIEDAGSPSRSITYVTSCTTVPQLPTCFFKGRNFYRPVINEMSGWGSMVRIQKKRTRARSRSMGPRRKKPTFRAAAVAVPSTISPRTGLGNHVWSKMLYAERFQIAGGLLGVASVQQYRTNSIFDPNFSGVGHQPSAHDQMAPLFEEYCVVSMKYKVVVTNIDGNNPGIFAVQSSDKSDTTSDIQTLIEQGQVEWTTVCARTGGPAVHTFQGYINNPKLMGKDRDKYLNSSEYVTAFGQNPQDQGYMNLYTSATGGGTGPGFDVMVEIEYNVLLLGGALVPGS